MLTTQDGMVGREATKLRTDPFPLNAEQIGAIQTVFKKQQQNKSHKYKQQVEELFQTGNVRQVWQGPSVFTRKASTKRTEKSYL